MRILIYRWKAFSYPDIDTVFRKMGHSIEVVERELACPDEDEKFQTRLDSLLSRTKYDLIFSMNYFGAISDVCQKRNVPYVSWTCDSPLISMAHNSVFNDCNYIFVFDRKDYEFYKKLGVHHIWHLPLAVDVDRVREVIAAPSEKDFAAAISYVGHIYEQNVYDQMYTLFPDYLRGYFDAMIEAQQNVHGFNIMEPMLTDTIAKQLAQYYKADTSKGSFADLGFIFRSTVLGYKAAEIHRKKSLSELSKFFEVNLYTEGEVEGLHKVKFMGDIDYWKEMPKVFNQSKININFTNSNIQSGIPHRVWDILGAGGFLMTDQTQEMTDYFEDGKDMVFFESPVDLKEKAWHYLNHEEERMKIAASGYEKVKEKHTYFHRIKEMFDIFEEECKKD